MDTPSQQTADPASQLSRQELLGLSRLVIQSVIGVTDVVEAMHSNISRVAPPIGRGRTPRARGLSGQIYSSVRGVTRLVGLGLETAHRWLPDIPLDAAHHPTREAVIARLNGVFGDHLEASGNPLAVRMALRQRGQRIFAADRNDHQLPANSRPVILVHGLCMSDLQWQQVDGHDHGAALARDTGMAPLYLHYNSGRRISANGRDLADLLQSMVERWPGPIDTLTLIGHSMGGLVIRSACHYGQVMGHDWPGLLGTAVFLGSPHHGAPLERIGNLAGRLLEASPYSAPIGRIGRLRSAGIQDLRHGHLYDPNRLPEAIRAIDKTTRSIGLLPHVDTHAIAASRSPQAPGRKRALKSDGLVPVDSALGQHRDDQLALDFPPHRRHLVLNTSHLQLLGSQDVYCILRDSIFRRSSRNAG